MVRATIKWCVGRFAIKIAPNDSETKARFSSAVFRGSQSKKHASIIRAHRGRDFALGLPGIRELRAPTASLRRQTKKNRKTRTTAKTTWRHTG